MSLEEIHAAKKKSSQIDFPIKSEAMSDAEMLAALKWQLDMGATDCISALPVNRFIAPEIKTEQQTSKRPAVTKGAGSQTNINTDAVPKSGDLNDYRSNRKSALPSMGSIEEAQSAAQSANSLEALYWAVKEFNGGNLKQMAKSCVFGEGSETADLMVVGEAPGADEDKQSKPFVGISGLLLDTILAAIGYDRSTNTRLTNVIPWRPLGNRTPDPLSVKTFLPFLEKHIYLVKPKLVLTLGKVATTALTDKDESISRLRGKLVKIEKPDHSFSLMPTYHLNYLLKSPAAKGHVWRDVLAVKDFLQ